MYPITVIIRDLQDKTYSNKTFAIENKILP